MPTSESPTIHKESPVQSPGAMNQMPPRSRDPDFPGFGNGAAPTKI